MYIFLGISTLLAVLGGSIVYVASSRYQATERIVAAFLKKTLKVLAGTAPQTIPERIINLIPGGNL
jgi:hypothetical protein